jgi:tRNA pseudouridine32 synthase/23S rRNA pseudouridine746 synthase
MGTSTVPQTRQSDGCYVGGMADDDNPRPGEPLVGRTPDAPATRPSTVMLLERPPRDVQTIFDFFLHRFPRIPRATWVERFAAGKVWTTGMLIDAGTLYQPLLEVHYRREVEREPPVRTDFRVVWSDRHLMVVDKPPNLPVTPGGRWVRSCLLHLLLEATGNDRIVPLHRLDRLTSGLLLLSLDPATRSHFAGLFQPCSMVEKDYTAVCELRRDPPSQCFALSHHIARNPHEYWRQEVRPGLPANARCEVRVMAVENGLVLARVRPFTGRKHQIRVQLAHEGLPILGDPLYGCMRSYDPDDESQRLWLDAHRLAIRDFPGPPGNGILTGAWDSSRRPTEFFRRAARSTDRLEQRPRSVMPPG